VTDSDGPQMPVGQAKNATVALVLICGAQFMLQLDFSIVNVALPTIQRDLGMASAELQWIVTGYALTFGSLLLAGGRLADIIGRRRLLVLGLVSFAVASVACGVSQWPAMLIISRVVQGAAGAMVSPAALSLLTTMHPEGPARNRALSIWQATTAAGATAGIVAGGVLTEYLGWRAIFLVNPPLIVLLLLFVRRLPSGGSTGSKHIDIRGAALITTAIAVLIFGLSFGQQRGFGSPTTVIALVVSLILGLGFLQSQRTAEAPMLPKAIFASATRRAAASSMLLVGAVVAGYVYFSSLFLQRVEGFSPVATGLALLPSTLTVVTTSTVVTRRLLNRFTVKTVLIGGLAVLAAGQAWLAQISAHSGYGLAVLPGLVLTAFGMGLVLPTASIAITSGVQGSDQGLAGAIFTTSQQTGAAIGLAVLATIAAAETTHTASLVDGYRFAFLASKGFVVLAVLLVAAQLNSKKCQEELQRDQPPDGGTASARLAELGLRKV
jgi:EmrB/QacA subfamily drug resistance transporter